MGTTEHSSTATEPIARRRYKKRRRRWTLPGRRRMLRRLWRMLRGSHRWLRLRPRRVPRAALNLRGKEVASDVHGDRLHEGVSSPKRSIFGCGKHVENPEKGETTSGQVLDSLEEPCGELGVPAGSGGRDDEETPVGEEGICTGEGAEGQTSEGGLYPLEEGGTEMGAPAGAGGGDEEETPKEAGRPLSGEENQRVPGSGNGEGTALRLGSAGSDEDDESIDGMDDGGFELEGGLDVLDYDES
ncbi:unnamed protein product [Ectocarpus sp. 13 AM-2016]